MTHDESTTTAAPPSATAPLFGRAQILPWAVASVAVLAALALSIWNANLRSDHDRLQGRLATALQENATIRQNANASAYQLRPTEQGPANANATAWFSLNGSGVLSVANLPQPKEGTTYQLWYLTDPSQAPIPGGTFTVDAQGMGFMLIPADVGTFSSIGISAEPEGGSATLSGPLLLSSDVSGARG
ncbi:MAG TPA: anti-sigma factor [Thermomicrobiales bacterium]|jgi:hypothetical protein|nr:anti-sigma factor [Thermomicrobiales bacterium]